MVKNITVFTTDTCAYCVMVKRFLQVKGVEYEEINLDEHPERRNEAFALSGQLTVPVTVVTQHDNTKEIVVGYNLSRLAPTLA